MSIISGYYTFDENIDCKNIKNQLINSIYSSSKNIQIYENTNKLALIKFDYNLFDTLGYYNYNDCFISMLSGEPFGESESKKNNYSRYNDLKEISHNLYENNINILHAFHGTYSLCFYDNKNFELTLLSDKLGVRPLYYFFINKTIIFSNCIKSLLKVDLVKSNTEIDFESFVQRNTIGTVLGKKTKFRKIYVLQDSEILKFNKDGVNLVRYYDWSKINIKYKEKNLVLQKLYNQFENSVYVRSINNTKVMTFLSGGLDSRCIVSILNKLKKDIIIYNSYIKNDKDEIYSKKYSESINIKKYISIERTKKGKIPGQTDLLLYNTIRDGNKLNKNNNNLSSIFSGDGGSVILGHVYLTDEIISCFNNCDYNSAANLFLKEKSFTTNLFKEKYIRSVNTKLKKNVINEFHKNTTAESTKQFYLFLLRNDQRRHLHDYYENIDKYRIELKLPFFDSRFVQLIFETKIEPFLNHKLYHELLNFFPKDILKTPWQTYPGHIKCPIESNENAQNQWDNKDNIISTKMLLKIVGNLIFNKKFSEKLNLLHVLIVLLLHTFKLKNYDYLLIILYSLIQDIKLLKN